MFPLTFEVLYPLYGVIAKLSSHKRTLWLALAILAMLISVLGITVRLQRVPTISIQSTQTSKVAPPTPSSPVIPAPAVVPAAPSPAAPAAAPQNCTPASYSLPTRINLLNQPVGLSQIIDPPIHYQVFGNTSAQIKAQLRQCAPAINSTATTNFSAETGSSLVWEYDSTSTDTGACVISNVKVGLHLNMILPQWQPTGSEDSGLANKWQSLINSVTVHENGHVAIHQQYAQQLLNDLQSLPAADCASMAASAAAKSAAYTAAVDNANKAYDVRTNHGVNQGAVLR